MEIPGFERIEEVSRGRDAIVLRAFDGERDVLLRVSSSEYPRAEDLAKLRYGYDLASSIDAEGVVKAYALKRLGRRVVVVMEDFGGRTLRGLLDERRLSVPEALDLGAKLARALGELHRKGLVHKNVEPTNVFVNTATGELKIANLDIASRLTREPGSLASPKTMARAGQVWAQAGTISPSATGRPSSRACISA